ncbi:MAG: hypothetical protein EOO10_15030 [Chitinophagaceae bacterium]|nr:MAG: hypothetical protein EOO10_15030 [Chitinophagaceae bacterium]
MKNYFVVPFIVLFCFTACAQQELYNNKDYKEIWRGAENLPDRGSISNVVIYKNIHDSDYALKKVYLDSSYSRLIGEHFYFKSTLHGPFKTYNPYTGKLFQVGFYKNNLLDGLKITYRNEIIISKSYFKNGIKTGVWEEYNNKGRLIEKVFFDKDGNEKARNKF